MEAVRELERLGLRRPDSRVVREAEELLREVIPGFLCNHSFRCYYYAAALGERDEISFDEELLYVAALFHDLGLVADYDTGACFEDDGAAACAAFAAARGWPERRCSAAAEAIRLHMAADIALGDGPEAVLLWHSTGFDVRGHRYSELSPDTIAGVLRAYPRLDFKEGFARLLADQAERKPRCAAARWVKQGGLEAIGAAPFPS